MNEYKRNLIEDTNYSLENLLVKYGNKLVYFINNIIHNMTVSEDLMEDSFVQIVLKKKTFKDESKFRIYLFKTGRNKALNYLKRSSLIRFENLEDNEEKIIDEKSSIEDIYI
jgi:RNA polymerase sigma factor (sigma-70 family)